MLSNIILGAMILASVLGGGIYASKYYILDKLRKNTERME